MNSLDINLSGRSKPGPDLLSFPASQPYKQVWGFTTGQKYTYKSPVNSIPCESKIKYAESAFLPSLKIKVALLFSYL